MNTRDLNRAHLDYEAGADYLAVLTTRLDEYAKNRDWHRFRECLPEVIATFELVEGGA